MKGRRWFSAFFGLAVLLCGIQLSFADASFVVDESAIKVLLDKRQTRVSLALRNGTEQTFPAHIQLELLDPASKVRATAALDVTVKRGSSNVTIPLAFPYTELVEAERKEFPWYRLRYSVTPKDSGGTASTVTGVVSISEITPDLFEMRVNAASDASAGSHYRARVRTANPVTEHPVKDVLVEATLNFDAANDKKISLKASGTTDAEGFATLDFNLPPDTPDDGDAELKVSARRGFLTQDAETEVKFNQEPRLLLTTDKPLYQPGQMLHARALVFDATHHAIPDTTATLQLEDPEGTTVYRTTIKTSRFGVANADWQIPDNTRLGDYWLKFELDDEKYSDETNEIDQRVKISRYDLPNFSVSTKPDHPFYLGGQNAEVEVHSDYLFGQPVKKGRVRVVRETERRWNYKEQKYETKEHEELKGETDASGLYVAHLDLSNEHKKLRDEEYSRFQDLNFAAYVTDPTTNRTEQRRFSLRLTKDPIHVYINQGRYRQAEGLPLTFYVSTSYADGTPAQCDVSVSQKGATISSTRTADGKTEEVFGPDRAIVKVKTNRFGVAKISGPAVHLPEDESNIPLRIIARDREGQTGHNEEDFWVSSERTEIRVETDKSLYGAGEPIVAEISSNKKQLNLFVEVSNEGRVINSQLVRLENGRATLTLPFNDEYIGRIGISAESTGVPENSSDDYSIGARIVVFPRNRELKLDVRFAQTTYRPGEDASADVTVRAPDGGKVESALGVVVFDKAVEERARTEQEFGSNFGFDGSFYYLWYGAGDVGGITPRDIEQLDLSKPHPDELELVAELLFNNNSYAYRPNIFGGTEYESDQHAVFEKLVNDELKQLRATLAARYDAHAEYPTGEDSLRRILSADGLDFDAQRDPWGEPFRVESSINRDADVLTLWSDGPDKKAKTKDDFTAVVFSWPYFRSTGTRFNRAVSEYHARTGGHIRNLVALKDELMRHGFNLDELRDRWGQPYAVNFGIEGTSYTITFKSSGPNKTFEPEGTYPTDDFIIWTTYDDAFAESRAAVDRALVAYVKKTSLFPQTDAELRDALKQAGLSFDDLRDASGNHLYATFRMDVRHGDHITFESRGKHDPSETRQHTAIRPVNQTVYYIALRSVGADGKTGTPDDFDAASYSSLVSEQAAGDASAKPVPLVTTFADGTGAIAGTVTDPNGAVISGVTVKAIHEYPTLEYETTTDSEGKYILRNLPSGMYRLEFTANGFKNLKLIGVQVQSSNLITADVEMNVGGVMETVTVMAGSAEVVNTSSMSRTFESRQVTELPINGKSLITKSGESKDVHPPPLLATPRLREEFPETLLWQPEVVTDKQGRAQVRFKLADNITTWKMSVIASTEDGELATVEKEVRAFQPFFAELDPPRVLTEGDQISLPVVLRNYLDRAQAVDFEIKPENWFTLNGPARQRAEVPAGDSSRQTFDIRTVASINDGRQRVTAHGADANDAIEKPVTVHPDGEEISQTAAQIFNDTTTLDINVPADVINHTTRSELKIYPNLSAHLLESVEGILQRPYGCGEQTISSTYPSVLVLKLYKGRGNKTNTTDAPSVVGRARRYAQLGYERLLNYRAEGGGFTYWGRGDADLALTAYALRFLNDASAVIAVDNDLIKETRAWLVKQQREDGSWPAYTWGHTEDRRRTALVTAFIARVLAASEGDNAQPGAQASDRQDKPDAAAKVPSSLQRALRFLSGRIEEIDEPYLIASYALAAMDAGEQAGASHAVAKLQTLALDEGAASYWSLETNTPFYGWGTAGRVETTALVVQALARSVQDGSARANTQTAKTNRSTVPYDRDALVNRGLLFLIRNKDRYGVWLSTQATVNVLDTLIRLFKQDAPRQTANGNASSGASTSETSATIFVNGRSAGELALPPAGELAAPVTLDLSSFITTGENHVEIRRPNLPTQAQAQTVTTFYVPWSKSDAASNTQSQTPHNASALRLAVKFDRASAGMTQEINCHVEAERIGHSGYGMMLAEVGLPPGADVDRASLERTMKESGWSISRYDLLPDRLVVYLWPSGGGTKFDFKFHPRFGLDAQTAPSQLYDYYNPEARTVVAPTRFMIR